MRRLLFTSTLVMAIAGCQALPPWMGGAVPEGKVDNNYFASANVTIGGRTFELRAADGKALGDVMIMAGGRSYRLQAGKLSLPESALNDAKVEAGGFFRIFAPGYAPKQVWIGQTDPLVLLAPVTMLVTERYVPAAGGTIKTKDGAVALELPAGLLEKPETAISLSTYAVPAMNATQADESAKRRADLIALAKKAEATGIVAQGAGNVISNDGASIVSQGAGNIVAQGAGNYKLAQLGLRPTTCDDAEDPFPCTPPELGLGLQVVVDGPLRAGAMRLKYDLDAMSLEEKSYQLQLVVPAIQVATQVVNVATGALLPGTKATVANRIKQTLAQLDGKSTLYRDQIWTALEDSVYNIKRSGPNGHVLDFKVDITAGDVSSRVARVQISDFADFFGAQLEVTVVSAINGELPETLTGLPVLTPDPEELPPVIVVPPVLPGINLISGNTGNIISSNTSNLLSNNGGSLQGSLKVPFQNNDGKYSLLAYQDYPWPGAAITAIDTAGTSYGNGTLTDANSNYKLEGLPSTPALLILKAQAGSYVLRTLAEAPGDRAMGPIEIDAATSLVSALVLDELSAGRLPGGKVDIGAFWRDVAHVRPLLSQKGAQDAVSVAIPQAAAQLRTLLTGSSYNASVLSPTSEATPTPTPTATPNQHFGIDNPDGSQTLQDLITAMNSAYDLVTRSGYGIQEQKAWLRAVLAVAEAYRKAGDGSNDTNRLAVDIGTDVNWSPADAQSAQEAENMRLAAIFTRDNPNPDHPNHVERANAILAKF